MATAHPRQGGVDMEKIVEKEAWTEGPILDDTLGKKIELPAPLVAGPEVDALPDFPGYIALEVTNACNFECTHCNYRHGLAHYTRPRGFMNPDTAEKALKEAAAHGADVLMNYDGEPLMNKRHMEYLRLAQSLGVKSYFNTNGSLFNHKYADELVTFYKGSVFFSVDGSKEWFEKIRLGGKYEQVVSNIEYFMKVNEAGRPMTIGISLCNLGQSAEERQAFLDRWLPLAHYVSMGEVNDKFGTMISSPMTKMKVAKRPICWVPWSTLGVCHNGDVIPCSIYITRANTANAIFGNIHEASLKEIWHGDAFWKFRKMVAEERYKDSYCDKCDRWRSQFTFPDVTKDGVKITRNGFWTTFHNMRKGKLNFR